jgi:high frequency lysogenization protein
VTNDAAVIGLAGTFQAARLVLDLARDGRTQATPAFEASLASVLRVDADSAADVYGGVAGVALGLDVLAAELDGPASARDAALARTVATVLHLERKVVRRTALRDRLAEGIRGAERSAEALGAAHETVVERRAELYTGTISTLRPRIIVQGNGLYLSQPRIVAQIRALLLAAIRGAVLWRQSGGSGWRLVLGRRAVVEAARRLRQSARPGAAS